MDASGDVRHVENKISPYECTDLLKKYIDTRNRRISIRKTSYTKQKHIKQ